MAGASFTPDILWEDPYFTEDSKRPLTRREAVLWIAKHIRREDNCVTKKGEIDASLRHLADKWNWAKTTVERFLKKCEKLGILVLKKCKINGTVQYVISYCFSTLSAFSTKMNGTASGTGAGQERDKVKSRKSEEKKDSPYSPPEGDEDPMAGLEPQPQRAAGAGHSKSPPDPQPQAAPDGAGSPPNSAAPPSRKSRERKQARLVPSDWVPSDATVVKMTDEVKATMVDIETERRRFVDYSQSTGRKYVELDSAFRNWLRNWAERRAKAMPQWKTAKEREFCI